MLPKRHAGGGVTHRRTTATILLNVRFIEFTFGVKSNVRGKANTTVILRFKAAISPCP
jgi:hypothetical protein